MSNDSNEPGNDTAACGVCGASLINGACEWCDAAGRRGDHIISALRHQLTLISRPTPAPAPAQTVGDDEYADDWPVASLYCNEGKHDLCHNPHCDCSCHDAKPASEPATPAPAATPPALDTHTLAATIRSNADRAQRLEDMLRRQYGDWSEMPETVAMLYQLAGHVADLAALYRYLAADVARYLEAKS